MRTAQDLFRKEKTDWIRRAQQTAYRLLLQRDTITIEDVLAKCPRPSYLRNSITGSVFKHQVFMPVGYTLARVPKSHSRVIRVWTFNEDFVPEELLHKKRHNVEESV